MKYQYIGKKKRFFFLITFLLFTSYLGSITFKKVNYKDISIVGSELISIDDIVTFSSLNFPTPLIFVKTSFIEKELKKNFSLKNVSVSRQIFPFGLKILIKTRTPKAYGERLYKGVKISGYIDKNGFFIDKSYMDIKNFKKLNIKVFGWKENFKARLSRILNSPYDEIEIITINFSPNGFLTLEEKHLKTILLGFFLINFYLLILI